MIKREQKKGFTLIELSVTMAIMALLSTLALAALFLIRKSSMVDQAAEEILSEVREAQNKAISVSDAPGGVMPVVWGVRITTGIPSKMETYYMTVDTMNNKILNEEIVKTYTYNQQDISISGLATFNSMYSTPFGKYYGALTNCKSPCEWQPNTYLPYDYIFPVAQSPVSSKVDIKISMSGYSKTITISKNGEPYAN